MCLVVALLHDIDLLHVLSRFGRDFGMLKSESDAGGLWLTMEEGIVYVLPLIRPCSSSDANLYRSICSMVSHIPWILPFLKLIPGSDDGFKRVQQLGIDCATARLQSGSNIKDLCYYLVWRSLSAFLGHD